MSFSLSLSADAATVTVRHNGVVTIDELETVVREIERLAESNPITGMLVDVRNVAGGPNKADYLIWVRNRERPAHVVPRMAIVRNEELADDMDFVLLTGQNRGIAVWDFTDEDEARSWLVQS